jgi:hypothetical protein
MDNADKAALSLTPAVVAQPLSDFDATMIAEGVQEADEATTIAAWQHLVDTGLAWKLQGFFGRTAQRLLDAGVISAPTLED